MRWTRGSYATSKFARWSDWTLTTQARRYEQLFAVRSTSEEIVTTKRQELQIADAALSAAREDIVRARSDREGLVAQRSNLRLIAPVDGVVAVRDADPGTTIVAGQAVVEVIDPKSLWINARFDQISASGLAGGLPTLIVLRSRGGQTLKGRVLRVEPKADAVTVLATTKSKSGSNGVTSHRRSHLGLFD